jgi:hypothetical protein
MKNSLLHSNQPGHMSHLLSLAMRQWLCPCPVSLSLAATATAATVSLVPSLQKSQAAGPACRAPGPRPPHDAAAAPCAGASRHHPMHALPGDEQGGAAPRRHPPTRPDGEGAAGGPQRRSRDAAMQPRLPRGGAARRSKGQRLLSATGAARRGGGGALLAAPQCRSGLVWRGSNLALARCSRHWQCGDGLAPSWCHCHRRRGGSLALALYRLE